MGYQDYKDLANHSPEPNTDLAVAGCLAGAVNMAFGFSGLGFRV